MAAYEDAFAGQPAAIGVERTIPGTLRALAVSYFASPAFRTTRPSTQYTYRNIIDRLCAEHGDKRVALLQREHIIKLLAARAPEASTNLTFLLTDQGKPYTAPGFGNWFRDQCRAAGLHGCSAHGLRKAAARRLAEAGCSTHEIAAITGHASLKEVARYTEAVDRRRLAASAMAKVRTLSVKPGGRFDKKG